MQLSAGGKVLSGENRDIHVNYRSIFYFSNLSTHPEKYFRTSMYRSNISSGDIVRRIAGEIHMNLRW
jgi:hypothetical protein